MKFKKETIASSGRPIYWLAGNLEELKLIFGILKTARRHFPETFELSQTRNRLNNIIKALSEVEKYHQN